MDFRKLLKARFKTIERIRTPHLGNQCSACLIPCQQFFEKIILFDSNRFNLVNNKIRIKLVQGRKIRTKELVLSIYKPGVSQFVYDIDLGIKQMRYLLKGDKRKMFKGKNKTEIYPKGLCSFFLPT